jgi:Domain of unknown function (DUF4166)
MRVVHGPGFLARVLIRLLRLPRASEAADMQLNIVADADGEWWYRMFDGVRVTTRQRRVDPDLLVERFGRLEFRFRVVSEGDEIRYEQTNVCMRVGTVALRLPAALAPTVEGRERARGADWTEVRIRVTWPPAGLILEYDGGVHADDRHA